MNFLSSPEALDLPDHIEEVNAKQLEGLIEEKTFVAVFFCECCIFYSDQMTFQYFLLAIFCYN